MNPAVGMLTLQKCGQKDRPSPVDVSCADSTKADEEIMYLSMIFS
jgi:hypothetical protein